MFAFTRFPRVVGCLAGALGIPAALWYAAHRLSLAHYDAKAHLVVSRRILDSLTPGWEQVGAVWLPLPHLLNMLPVQIDGLYRTGAFAIAISVASHALAAASIAALVAGLTSSRAGAAAAAVLYAANPNVLYLQSTPMTEPLLFGLTTLQAWLMTKWVLQGSLAVPRTAAWVTVLACLTRYEAWAITAALLAASAFASCRRGVGVRAILRTHARLSLYPLATILAFMTFSRVTVGEWFVSGGFFVADESLRGKPAAVLAHILDGTGALAGRWTSAAGAGAALTAALIAATRRARAPMAVPLALFASAVLPASAYLAGHPFRIRYEVPLVVACAVSTGLGVGLLGRAAPAAALVVASIALVEAPPFRQESAMIREARRDIHIGGRAHVTACLQREYRGGVVMMSMGALAHYMHELSAAGFDISDFLHEGNHPLWDSAITRGPAHLAEWVIVEEEAEGGDAIVRRYRQFPRLLEDYERICTGGNISLYRRRPARALPP